MIMTLDMDVTAERRHYNTHRPLKGKRLTTFCASLRSGGRRLAVRKMIECHIPAQTRTPFCHYVAFPLKGKREIWREKQASHILHVPFLCFPLWWLAPPPCPVGSMSYDTESKSRNADFISIARQGNPQPSARRAVKLKNPWARKGPSILRTFFRNPSTQPADRRPQPSGRSPVNPHAAGVSIKNFSFFLPKPY